MSSVAAAAATTLRTSLPGLAEEVMAATDDDDLIRILRMACCCCSCSFLALALSLSKTHDHSTLMFDVVVYGSRNPQCCFSPIFVPPVISRTPCSTLWTKKVFSVCCRGNVVKNFLFLIYCTTNRVERDE